MSLPTELKEPIDEIKTPSNRILVICLILAIMALFGWVIKLSIGSNSNSKDEIQRCEEDNARLNNEIGKKDSVISDLNGYIRQKDDEDKQRLIKRVANYDSIITISKYLKQNTK